jgi:translocon-associated protein subunit alpha
MARLSINLVFLILLVLPCFIQILDIGHAKRGILVRAQEDEAEGEEVDDGAVEDEEGGSEVETEEEGEDAVEEGDGDDKKNVHKAADTMLLFTKPASLSQMESGSVELPAGKVVEFLVGFNNKGDPDGIESPPDFVVETLDASFRYPMDFTFHIQNFSAIAYHKTVKAGQEATVAYSFIPADAFMGRSIGLTINLNYRDSEGNFYFDPVFNETVQIVEFDEGFDTEVFFMYVFMAAGGVLLLFLVFSFASRKKSKKSAHKKAFETGTANDDVDYEWIPRSSLRTPGSNKTSPRQRKGNRNAGSDTD